ncbi:MAG: potassium-transporting ATPase subunit KdpA, partial [Pseudorhodoplanes sp.]
MTAVGWLEIIIVLALVVGCAFPLGTFMATVFEGHRTFLTPIVGPLERGFYRLSGVNPEEEQDWLKYTLSMLVFAGGCFLALYL